MDNEANQILDLGSIDFTPAWAKKDAGVVVGKTTPVRESGERKPFTDRRGGGGGRAPDDRRPQAPRDGRPPRQGANGQKPGGGGRPFDRDRPRPFDRSQRSFDRPRPLDADVKILPETKALGTIMRKLQQDYHAYKLKDLAYFLLDNPSSVLLKITPRNPQQPDGRAEPRRFHQCKACGFASADEAEVAAHTVTAHLSDYFDAKEIECEPPKGNFNCVAKCGLSGVLLGPPNIHEFNATVREMIRTRYPSMSESEYRSHIEMVRDAEAIEEWRKGATKKTVFTAKGAGEGAPTLTREQAEAEFRRTFMPSMLDTPKSLSLTADVAMKCPPAIKMVASDALEAERRSPYAMCFALRGAFHHRKIHFFRVNDAHGQEFVTGVELKEFDAAHAIPELAAVAAKVAANPCSTKAELAADSDAEKQLAWLASTGHVVAFTNGVYSAVEKFPKYGPQWRKNRKPEAKPAEEAKAAAEPPPVEAQPPAEAQAPAEPTAEAPAPAEPEKPESPVAPEKPDIPDNPEIPDAAGAEQPAEAQAPAEQPATEPAAEPPPAAEPAPENPAPQEPPTEEPKEEEKKDEAAPQLA